MQVESGLNVNFGPFSWNGTSTGFRMAGSSEAFPVVFSAGDPNGVGPEVTLKAVSSGALQHAIRARIFGDRPYLEGLCAQLRLELPEGVHIHHVDGVAFPPSWGQVEAAAGRAALESLRAALRFCLEQQLPLLVTAPVSKRALHLAGCELAGQTEIVAASFPPSRPAMAFFSPRLHVLLITTHIPLARVAGQLRSEEIAGKGALFLEALVRLGISSPRVAVCGLNPHASESGLMGDEEERIVKPGVDLLVGRSAAGSVAGPFPADTLFRRALDGEFDGVIALYHDQGLIPLKLIAFEEAVNATLGLPLMRTSPDHGTAFDIAGLGRAREASMVAAVNWGVRLAQSNRS